MEIEEDGIGKWEVGVGERLGEEDGGEGEG